MGLPAHPTRSKISDPLAQRARRRYSLSSRGATIDPDQFAALRYGRTLPVQALGNTHLPYWSPLDYVEDYKDSPHWPELSSVEDEYQDRIARFFDDLNWVIPNNPDDWVMAPRKNITKRADSASCIER